MTYVAPASACESRAATSTGRCRSVVPSSATSCLAPCSTSAIGSCLLRLYSTRCTYLDHTLVVPSTSTQTIAPSLSHLVSRLHLPQLLKLGRAFCRSGSAVVPATGSNTDRSCLASCYNQDGVVASLMVGVDLESLPSQLASSFPLIV